MKRIGFVAGLALLLVALGSGMAGASGSFDKTSVPADTDVDMIVNAPVEILVGYNERVVLTVPAGFRVLSCGAINDYACKQTAAANPTRTLVTWEKTVAGQEFVVPTQQFPFRMRTIGSAGKYKFEVDQFYSNGQVQRSNGPEGSDNPAPILTVTAAGTPAVTNTTVPTTEAPPTTFSSSFTPEPFPSDSFTDTPPTTLALDTTPTTEATTDTTFRSVAIKTSGDGDGGGIKGTERIVLLGLAVLAVGAASFSTLRQRNAL